MAATAVPIYTLYSTSVTGGGDQMRIHVATFDSSYGEQYNEEKCEMGRRLFQQQAGVIVRYWCEKGRYRN